MLRQCYDRIRQVMGNNIIEPFESVALVEAYRQYWKPDTVRIVLLAESHLLTSDNDRCITIPPIVDLPGYPTEYAKFVYCLAYGENNLTRNPLHPDGDGTPQYWKVFYSCVNHLTGIDDFGPVQSVTPFAQRLNNKIAILKAMQERGIWLLDSSIIALYDNGRIYDGNTDKKVIKTSWDCYTGDVIKNAKPKHIICIGKTVAEVLESDIRKIVKSYTVTTQPNAHLTHDESLFLFKLYSKICMPNGICLDTHTSVEESPSPSILIERNDSQQEDRINELLSRAISPGAVQAHGQYTIPRTYGVYDVGAAGGRRYRCGNHPVRQDVQK
jgi:hypothetical protein